MAPQQLGDIRLEGGQIGRIPHLAADGDGAGHVPVEAAEGAAEEVDAGGDHRRAHAVVVEDDRLDEVVEMAPVVRGVDDAPAGADRGLRALDVLLAAVDLAENGIERMLQGAVHPVALGGPQLVQVAVHALRRLLGRLAPAAPEIARNLLP